MSESEADIPPVEPPPKLKVRKDLPAGIGPTKACPSCNASIAENAVICVQCGYNFKTGHQLSTSSGFPRGLLVGGGVVVALLVAVAAIVYLLNQFDPPAPLPPAPPAAPIAVAPVVAEITETVAEPEEIVIEVAAPTEAEINAAAQAEAAAAQATINRDQLRAQLEERFPPIQIGEQVALRMANGFVHRGRYLGARDGIAVVSDDGVRTRLPVAELDRESRLRVDADAREALVEQRLQQMQGVH